MYTGTNFINDFSFIGYLIISFFTGNIYYSVFTLFVKLMKRIFGFNKNKDIVYSDDKECSDFYLNDNSLKNEKEESELNDLSLNSKINNKTEEEDKNSNNLYSNSNLSKNEKEKPKYYDLSLNPKFNRTPKEKELSLDFFCKYSNQISIDENNFSKKFILARKSLSFDYYLKCEKIDIDEIIRLHEDVIRAFYDFKEFCSSKGEGGKIYFEDNMLHCHNSQNSCFSAIESTEITLNELKTNGYPQKAYYESLKKARDEIKRMLDEKGEIIQKEIYKQFLPLKASDIYIAISNLECEGFLYSEKYLNTRKLIKITNERKKPEKKFKVVDGIEPLLGYIQNFDELTDKQVECYKKIKEQLASGKFVEVGDSRYYIYWYIKEELQKSVSGGHIYNGKKALFTISNLYKDDEFLPLYVNNWLADCYVLSKEYDKALELYQSQRNISCFWSLKYKLKLPINAKELISFSRKNYFTKFVYDKYDKIEKYIDEVLLKSDIDYIQYFGDKYQKDVCDFPLFVGLPMGYELNKMNTDISFFNFRGTPPEIIELFQRICRDSENLLRTEMGIPKIGEGWISETELYYKIKELVPFHKVIHHYRDDWLGRQHLDIYIPDLKLAFEYQGLQHSKPIDFFGGEEAFLKNKERDELKKQKCKQAGVCLIEVYPDYDFKHIKNIINQYLDVKKISKKTT